MIDRERSVPGDYRIMYNPMHRMGPNWSWAYYIQQLKPAGKWLFFSWPQKWVTVRDDLSYDDAMKLVGVLQNGGAPDAVSYHKGR